MLNAKLVRSWKAKDTYTGAILTSKTPTHTQHQETVPSLLHSPSGPDFPFHCYPGVVEKKASHLTLSVWLPKPRLLKHTQPLIPLHTV